MEPEAPVAGGSVAVSVVGVRVVGMEVERAGVSVRVRMRFAPEVRLGMIVLVVPVMVVAMLMDDGRVRMLVLMPLGQV